MAGNLSAFSRPILNPRGFPPPGEKKQLKLPFRVKRILATGGTNRAMNGASDKQKKANLKSASKIATRMGRPDSAFR